jgi:hypothetical protein
VDKEVIDKKEDKKIAKEVITKLSKESQVPQTSFNPQ